jgi:hypothetical protein
MRKRIDPPLPRTVRNDESLRVIRAQPRVQPQESAKGRSLVIPTLQPREIPVQVRHEHLRVLVAAEPSERKAVPLTCVCQFAVQQEVSDASSPLDPLGHPDQPRTGQPSAPFVSEKSVDLLRTRVECIGQQGFSKASSLCFSEVEETSTQQFQVPLVNSDISGHHVSLANLPRVLHAHRRIIDDPSTA